MILRVCVVFIFFINTITLFSDDFKVGIVKGDECFIPILKKIYGDIGISPIFLVLEFDESIQKVNSGEIDADMARFPDVLGTYRNVVFTKEPFMFVSLSAIVKENFPKRTLSLWDLGWYSFVYNNDDNIARGLTLALKLKSITYSNNDDVYKAINIGKDKVGLSGFAFASFSKHKESSSGLVILDDPIYKSDIFHVMNKKWESLIPKFDKTLRTMKSNGLYNYLLSEALKSKY